MICEASIPNENSDKGNNFDCGEPPTKVLKYPAKLNPWMIPKNKVTKPITLMLSCFDDFPAVKRLKNAMIRMLIGIKNSIKLTLIITTPKTDNSKANVCPTVKRVAKSNNLFQSLNTYGIDNAVKNKM